MEIWTQEAESEYKLTTLVENLEKEFQAVVSYKDTHIYEIDDCRIFISGDFYGRGCLIFRVYKIIPGADTTFIVGGTASDVFDSLPERFSSFLIFHLDLLK